MLIDEEKIISLISEDVWMMAILKSAKSLDLPDWWICAGFVRSKIWDTLHDFRVRTPIPDIDVIYFDQYRRIRGKETGRKTAIPYTKPSLVGKK
jgi:hypothetical protein